MNKKSIQLYFIIKSKDFDTTMKNIPTEKDKIFKQTKTEPDITLKCEKCNFVVKGE